MSGIIIKQTSGRCIATAKSQSKYEQERQQYGSRRFTFKHRLCRQQWRYFEH